MAYGAVLIVTHEASPFRGGIATYVDKLASAARDRGRKVTVISPKYDDVKGPGAYGQLRLLRHHTVDPLRWLIVAAFVALRTRRDTLLHAADLRSAVLVFALSVILRRNYIVTAHGSEIRKLHGRGVVSRALRRAYAQASFVACNSGYTQQAIAEVLPSTTDLRVTPLGVGADWFDAPATAFNNPGLATIDPSACIVCTVGRMERRKGHLDVIKTLAPLFGTYPALRYVAAGATVDEAYLQEIQKEARKHDGRVIVAGALSFDDIRLLFARSRCHVIAASVVEGKVEGYGLVALEAGAQGCPTVATRVGGLPEAIVHNLTGLLVEPAQPLELAAAITSLLDQNSLRDALGRAAQVRAAAQTWAATAFATYGQ